MKLKKIVAITGLLLTTVLLNAQETIKKKDSIVVMKPEKKEPLFDVKFFGFIRHDAVFDSRQTVDVREAAVVLWGKDADFDSKGKDRNSASKFQMLDVLSRAGVKVNAPDVLGAKTFGFLEGDFFGNAEGGINEFRLRHAWITLDWRKSQLGIGQFWHPLTIPEMFPGVVNFSGGAPYMPYNRNPQIRFTQKLNTHFNLMIAAVSQRDFTSNTAPYRNSSIPSGHVQVNYKNKDVLVGLAGHFEQIRPKTGSGLTNDFSNERLNSVSVMAYGRFETKPMTIKAEAMYGENATSFIMLGGYVGYTPTTGSGLETYSTMATQSFWIDLTGKTKKIIPGFFAGFSQNDGATNPISGKAVAYGFSNMVGGIAASGNATTRTINYIYRLAPRIEVPIKNLKFGLEAEYSAAEWGNADNSGRAVSNLNLIGTWRVVFATVLKF
ncbi:DcaP family trimeric outer membrane transporter [Flavobacterium sp. AED]|uniref:DcaP family trimeric outer membrane transporter n=1 Tax=Flavobacterium sp. AED TaxID=1423323 RepID=UPI000689834C|nr:DcaP family trimeric outer membrane transporter [Flavobacterium sp. AED]